MGYTLWALRRLFYPRLVASSTSACAMLLSHSWQLCHDDQSRAVSRPTRTYTKVQSALAWNGGCEGRSISGVCVSGAYSVEVVEVVEV